MFRTDKELKGPHRAPTRALWPLVLCFASPGPQVRRYGICQFGSLFSRVLYSATDRRHIVLDITLGDCALSLLFSIGVIPPILFIPKP